ncbi:ABC transporter permease [Moraxella marmotae]|uniref:ABC transporter permease n=1 Tax=Moraxella marmotae TaxID=3344520 RepID=UPI0035F347EE
MVKIYLLLVLVILSVLSVLIGVGTPASALSWLGTKEGLLILTTSRIPRLIALVLTGIALAVSGVVLQHITNNKFIEPATAGSLDAAKLGILILIIALPDSPILLKMALATLFCFVASLLFIVMIRRVQIKSGVLIPVIGLMYGGVLSAFAEFYAYRHNMVQNMQGWLLGDFSKVVQGNYELIYSCIPILMMIYYFAHRFTVAGMGQGIANSLGLNYKNQITIGIFLVSLLTTITVITIGSISFIGLVVPNLVALRYGDNLGKTLPIIALSGACLVVLCDIFSRVLIYPYEIPIALTAGTIGGVIFLILILKAMRR